MSLPPPNNPPPLHPPPSHHPPHLPPPHSPSFSLLTSFRSTLREYTGIPPSFLHSQTFHTINPNAYTKNAMRDTRLITLPLHSLHGMSDEEILARFTKGFYGGWTFFLEKCFLSFAAWSVGFRVAGREGSGFPGNPKTGKDLPSFFTPLSTSTLPPKYSRIAGGNFLLLTTPTTPVPSSQNPDLSTGSFVDWAFGDSRGTFSGCHRFEVLRSERSELSERSEDSKKKRRERMEMGK